MDDVGSGPTGGKAKRRKRSKEAEEELEASDPLVIDGVELDRKEFDLGSEPPPLEEFRRLMESLGPETIFDEEAGSEPELPPVDPEEEEEEPSPEEVAWYPQIYEGGPEPDRTGDEKYSSWAPEVEDPAWWRVQVVSVVSNSSTNSTALDMVSKVYDLIRAGTNNDSRINYQTICFQHADGSAVEELDDCVQMWLEGYNTYHLIDGKAMKEAWGAIMPHIMLSEKNIEAIVAQVQWALMEDTMDGALLTPRLRRVRFRGGAQEMTTGFNTEHLDSEFSVVSVR